MKGFMLVRQDGEENPVLPEVGGYVVTDDPIKAVFAGDGKYMELYRLENEFFLKLGEGAVFRLKRENKIHGITMKALAAAGFGLLLLGGASIYAAVHGDHGMAARAGAIAFGVVAGKLGYDLVSGVAEYHKDIQVFSPEPVEGLPEGAEFEGYVYPEIEVSSKRAP